MQQPQPQRQNTQTNTFFSDVLNKQNTGPSQLEPTLQQPKPKEDPFADLMASSTPTPPKASPAFGSSQPVINPPVNATNMGNPFGGNQMNMQPPQQMNNWGQPATHMAPRPPANMPPQQNTWAGGNPHVMQNQMYQQQQQQLFQMRQNQMYQQQNTFRNQQVQTGMQNMNVNQGNANPWG